MRRFNALHRIPSSALPAERPTSTGGTTAVPPTIPTPFTRSQTSTPSTKVSKSLARPSFAVPATTSSQPVRHSTSMAQPSTSTAQPSMSTAHPSKSDARPSTSAGWSFYPRYKKIFAESNVSLLADGSSKYK